MDRWCPRCEWVGSTRASRCPSCATPLLDVERPTPPPPALVPAAPDPADAAGESRQATHRVSGPRRMGGRDAPRRPLAVGLPAFVLLTALVAWALLRPAGAPGGEGAGAARLDVLPDRLAYVVGALRPGSEAWLYVARGDGRDRRLEAALVREPRGRGPATSAGSGVDFGWAPDGEHAWVLDAGGRLRLVPEGITVEGRVRDAAFSPDGRLLAVCAGSGWPPRLSVVPVITPRRDVTGGVPGCEPRWSPDGARIAFRVPARERETYDASAVGVLEVGTGSFGVIGARWPATWLGSFGWGEEWLGVVSPDGPGIAAVAASLGESRGVVADERVESLVPEHLQEVRLVAPSPQGAWVALGLESRVEPERGAVAVVGTRTTVGAFFTLPGPVESLSWSPQGHLLVEGGEVMVAHGGTNPVRSRGVHDASWSPDGRFILARDRGGWVVLDAGLRMRRRLPSSSAWLLARWCCPPVPAVRAGR